VSAIETHPEDLQEIGEKIVEMAERVRDMDRITPGAVARWGFEMDDVRYGVRICVEPRP
jgi:hypothetical protein